ncbi:MAG: carboxypeptidase-like regulatory domain-containing protein [Terracidiphilus sp.]
MKLSEASDSNNSRSFRCNVAALFVGILAIAMLLGAPRAFAQTANGIVSGHVIDPRGALIPGAAVTLTETDTNVEMSTSSNSEGLYTFASVKPGNYRMKVSASGFSTVTISGLTIAVQGSLSRDVALEIGTQAQIVTVTAEEADAMVAQTSSELGTEIAQAQIHDLPLNGRNFTQLLTLTPGASPVMTSQAAGNGVYVDDQGVLGVPGSTFELPAMQGQITRENLYLLDGVVNTDFTNGVYVIPPIIDDLQEFKVQSHDDKAEFGGVLGGVVNVVTKSGTNQFHGSGWEFVRNDVFDARDTFKDAPENGVTPGPSPYRQNMYGGTVGGPVLLPRIYNGRNRTFFLFGYEGWRYAQSGQEFFDLPTAAELSGDFSHSSLASSIFDPSTTTLAPGGACTSPGVPAGCTPSGYVRTQFDYNGVPNTINPASLNQDIINFLKTYDTGTSAANTPGGYNAYYSSPRTDNADHYMFRIDEQLGGRNSLFFRFDQLNVVDLTPNSATQNTSSSVDAVNWAAGWTYVITPSVLFDFRFGIATRPFNRGPAVDTLGTGPLQKLGFTAAGGTLIDLQKPYDTPGIQDGFGSWTPNTITNPVYSYTPTLTWVHGGHNIKLGMQYIQQGSKTYQPQYGDFGFTNTTTGDPNNVGTTGNSLASALLGYPATNGNTPPTTQGNRVANYAGYAEDAWTISRSVTFTYGLRADHRRPFAPIAGSFTSSPATDGIWWIGMNALPGACAVVGQQPCIPSANGTLAGIDGGVAAVDPDTGLPWYNAADPPIQLSPYGTAWGADGGWDYGPRLGVAWRFNSKTTIRGGAGFAYDATQGIDQDWKANAGQWPANGSVGGGFAMNTTVSTVAANGGPQSYTTTLSTVQKVLPASDPWSLNSWYTDPHIQDPRSLQYNLTIERELGSSTALSVAYVGSRDDRLAITGQWNTALTPGNGTASEVRARTPFPWYNTSAFYSTSNGWSNYNALQIKLEKRFSNGLQYLANYTWSKALGTGGSGLFAVENGPGGYSVWQNYYDLAASKGALAFNIPQILTMEGEYVLPFGVGKRYMSHGLAASLLGNWTALTNISIRSGQPYNFDVSGDVANIESPGSGSGWFSYERPNEITSPKLAHPSKTEAFNVNAFAVPTFGTFGNAGTSPLYSMHVADTDMSVFKDFPIHEQFSINFRAEAFNVFNIQNYGPPDTDVITQDPSAGTITSNVTNPRLIQLGVHLNF